MRMELIALLFLSIRVGKHVYMSRVSERGKDLKPFSSVVEEYFLVEVDQKHDVRSDQVIVREDIQHLTLVDLYRRILTTTFNIYVM